MKLVDLFTLCSPYDYKINMPHIIAEAGVNHGGDISLAKRLIDEAKEGGADTIKFQTYKADTIASKNSPAYWDTAREPTKSQYELFCKYDTFWKNEFEILKRYCDEVNIGFMSTPFDLESALFLNDLMEVFKISSSDITNKPFIEYICRFEKPIILSTGASYLHEIQEAVSWIDSFGNPLALMHCVLNYPTEEANAHLGMILDLKRKFSDKIIGYSDHTLPKDMETLKIAALLGAVIIEKHFTHDKTLSGNDHYHAMDKEDLKSFKQKIDRAFNLLGTSVVTALKEEEPARQHARRSLVSKCLIPKGRIITDDDITWKRPAHGISPKHIHEVIGKKARIQILEDTTMQWTMIE